MQQRLAGHFAYGIKTKDFQSHGINEGHPSSVRNTGNGKRDKVEPLPGHRVKTSFRRANEIMDDHSHVSHLNIIGHCRANSRIMPAEAIKVGE